MNIHKTIDACIKKHARSMEVYLEYNAAFFICSLSEFAGKEGYDLFEMQRGNIKSLEKTGGARILFGSFKNDQPSGSVGRSPYN